MVTYVGLMSFTEEDMQSQPVKETTKRAAASVEFAKKAGLHIRELLWTGKSGATDRTEVTS